MRGTEERDRGEAHLGEHPAHAEGRLSQGARLLGVGGLEVVGEVLEREANGVPELVAELSVSNDSLDVEVDAALDHVVEEGESESVSAALRDTRWEVLGFGNDRLLDFTLWEVGVGQLLEKDIESAAVHDLERVDDISL